MRSRVRAFELSQQPTDPQVKHLRSLTHGTPSAAQPRHTLVLGPRSSMASRWLQSRFANDRWNAMRRNVSEADGGMVVSFAGNDAMPGKS